MKHHYNFAESLVAKGGPDPEDYADLDAWFAEIGDHLRCDGFTQDETKKLIQTFGDAFSVETIQGHVFRKPHGYAGDFEIIDRIYQRYLSSCAHLTKWDQYAQSHPAAEAVRNRASYFIDQIQSHVRRKTPALVHILNLASGPGRDMLNFFSSNPAANVFIDCVEQDQNAIEHARILCKDHLASVRFHRSNAFRFESETQYDLVWSAGLFDYFDEKAFVFILCKLKSMVAPQGEIIVGNFSPTNPSRHYMQVLDWVLHYRSPQTLRHLANEAGFANDCISISREPLGVNLFLHIRN